MCWPWDPPGTGKTHLLCALGQELVYQAHRVIIYTSSELVGALVRANQEQALPEFMKQPLRYEALIIGGLGYVKRSLEEMDMLFHLSADRYERASALITTQLPFSQWETIFYDPMNATVSVDRLVHHCVVLELNQPSYRLEVAQRP